MQKGRSGGRCGLDARGDPMQSGRFGYLSSSPPDDDGFDEPPGLHDGAAGLGVAQLGAAGAGAGAGVGAAAGAAGLGAAGLGAAGFGAAGLGIAGFAAAGMVAAGLAAGAAFFAGLFLALAFLADFFGAAAFDFLADFFADFLAFFADFFEDFFADFFFAVRTFFLFFLLFLPPFFFLPLAIMILLLPLTNVHRAFQVVRLHAGPIDQFNPGRGPPVAQSRSSIVCTTGTDVPPAI
jgi:hypothetical protein